MSLKFKKKNPNTKSPSLHYLLAARLKRTLREDKGGNCSKELHTTEFLRDPSSGQDLLSLYSGNL